MKRTILFAGTIFLSSILHCAFAQTTETSKYDNGKTEYSFQYDANGDEHGEWKYYFENGQLEMLENYNHGWPSGLWETYYENGQLESKGNYNSEGYENGIWEAYYENGQVQYKGEFNKGKPSGEWKIYFEDGSLEASLNFNENGKPTGELLANFKDGKTKVRGSFDANGKKTGTWNIYTSDDKLKSEIVYNNNEISAINSALSDEGVKLEFTKQTDGPQQGQWLDQEGDGVEEVNYHAIMHVINF